MRVHGKERIRKRLAAKGVYSFTRQPRLSMDEKAMTLRALASIERKLAARPASAIHPDVLDASADDLIAAGWTDYERHLIPPDWRKRKPGQKPGKLPTALSLGQKPTSGSGRM